MDKAIYISHCFGNKQSNKDRAENTIKRLMRQYPQYLFISPISALGFMYSDMDYDTGMEHCLALLDLCDEMWICSEDSKGVELERAYCQRYNIPVKEHRPEVEMVEFISCSKCAKLFETLDKAGKVELIKERKKLQRCMVCERVK